MLPFPLHHIGIAVSDLETSIASYKRDLGCSVTLRETIAESGVMLAFLELPNTRLELLTPTREGTTLAKFLASRGPGLHHLCYEVRDIVGELAKFKAAGHELIDSVPRKGAAESKIAFLHPKTFEGVLVELCQPAGK